MGFLDRIFGLGKTPHRDAGIDGDEAGTGTEEAGAARERAPAPRFRCVPPAAEGLRSLDAELGPLEGDLANDTASPAPDHTAPDVVLDGTPEEETRTDTALDDALPETTGADLTSVEEPERGGVRESADIVEKAEAPEVAGGTAVDAGLDAGFASLEAEALASVASEFDDFLADMGAVPVSEEESKLAIRDATIAELQRNLADLRPLGDELAETEKARLALAEQVAELERQMEEAAAQHARQLADVEKEREKLERAGQRLKKRLGKAREKFAKRDRVATERWHAMRKLQRERRELREQLEQVVKDCARTPADLARENGEAPRPNLAALFDPEPGEGDRALPHSPDSASIQA